MSVVIDQFGFHYKNIVTNLRVKTMRVEHKNDTTAEISFLLFTFYFVFTQYKLELRAYTIKATNDDHIIIRHTLHVIIIIIIVQ